MARAELWNAAEAAEKRKDARVAREYCVALPAELPAAERRELALEFALALADRYGCAADCCVHAPGKKGDQRNHHAHILVTTRTIGPDGLGDKCTCELKDKDRKARGLGSGPMEIKAVRALWADVCNRALERVGAELITAQKRTDGLGTIHVGVAATAMERRGETTKRGNFNRKVKTLRAEVDEAAKRLAEAKKALAEAEAPAPEKSEMEKRRDAILAHPSVNDTVRGMLTDTGWEGWVETYEGLLGIVPGAEQEPQPAAADLDNAVLDEQIGVADAKPQAPDPALVDAAMAKILPQKPRKPADKSQGGGKYHGR